MFFPSPNYKHAYSNGVGRTAVFICLDILFKKIQDLQVVDIEGTINKMRHEHMKMINSLVNIK